MARTVLSAKEKFIVGNYVLAHCKIPEGSQYARWDNESGGSDATAAERLRVQIPYITKHHVQHTRLAFDLPLEPQRLIYIRHHSNHKPTDYDILRDKVEALVAHVKTCDVRLKDYDTRITTLERAYEIHATAIKEFDARIAALEDRYTNPKGVVEPPAVQPQPSKFQMRLINEASERAVGTVIDPILPPPPTNLRRWKKRGRR